MDDRVITINQARTFSLLDAEEILPVVRRITHEWAQKVETLIARLEAKAPEQLAAIEQLEAEINSGIQMWHEKIKKLGASPKGLWLVDFDCGDGYYCWKYPETKITHWHSYEDGFSGRVPIHERHPELEHKPDLQHN